MSADNFYCNKVKNFVYKSGQSINFGQFKAENVNNFRFLRYKNSQKLYKFAIKFINKSVEFLFDLLYNDLDCIMIHLRQKSKIPKNAE